MENPIEPCGEILIKNWGENLESFLNGDRSVTITLN